MNGFFPQSIQSRTELELIANVKNQIVGAKNSNPIIGCVQDGVTGSYLISLDDVKMTGKEAHWILSKAEGANLYKLDKNKIYTGKEIYSMIIPDGINSFKKKGDKYSFQVKDGKLKTGVLDKSQVADKANSLTHFVYDKKGGEAARMFLDDTQRTVLNYLIYRGFTVGFGDCFIKKEIDTKLHDTIIKSVLDNQFDITSMENQGNVISYDTYEDSLQSAMTAVGGNTFGMVEKNLDKNNNFYIMSLGAKAKGKGVNIGQIVSCLGQQTTEGKRVQKKVNGRTLSHFAYNDDTAFARGFVGSSYLEGMKGYEYFFHSVSGREGMITIALKSVTWETPIVILENNKPVYTEIGKWIDNLLDNNPDEIELHKERNMELLKLKHSVIIPTMDYDGNVSWAEVTDITRHDPGQQLYKITTHGGREVIVTESKSLLVWNDRLNQFREELTPNIKEGDFVPVTNTLEESPVVLEKVNLEDYLNKKDYLYGTDYHNAIKSMKKAMKNRAKIPAGWWNDNNGKSFTLPFDSKARLQRCLVRSNQNNIKENCVYPFHAFRNSSEIKDTFDFTYDNGMFLGLFLAEGNVNKSTINITNVEPKIKDFVKKWFDSNNIKWSEYNRTNNYGGRSETIRGTSSVFGDFLKAFVGHRAENKFIPSEIFIAPLEFIKGLLSGYFSGDGYISKNSIKAASASKRLIEGVNMLCSRLGIFGRVSTVIMKKNNLGTKNIKPSYNLIIAAQWAKKFSEEIELIHPEKQLKSISKKWNNSHRNFKTHNDVVLDKIVKIELVDVKEHPKVYDLTIPKTYNFGLANGLQVRDTSSTGYIQRKLIKALEDLRVTYDGTVRNSNGTLVEYNYGNTGIDQLVQSSNKIYTILYSNKDIEEKLGMSDKELKQSKSDKKTNEKYISIMKELRDKIRRNSIDSVMNYKTIEDSFLLPVNLYRIVQDKSDDNRKVKFDLSYQYILDKIEQILIDDKTSLMSKQAKFQEEDERSSKTIFKLALMEYLSPKKCLFEYNLNKQQFDEIIEEVKIAFLKAVVNPGEMVGVITAQSIGEPVTQLNLDSKHSAGMAKGASKANSGVPRIEEILSYSKNIKTPMASLYLKEPNNDKLAFRITNYLNQIKIGDLISKAEIYYYNDTNNELDEMLKNDKVGNPFFFNNQRKNIEQFPWIFRLELDRETLLDKDVVLLDIKTKLTLFYYNVIQDIKSMKKDQKEIWENIIAGAVLSNQDTSDIPTIHIRLGFNNFNFPMITKLLKIFLNDVYLKGVNGITSAFNSKDIMIDMNDKTGEIDFKQDYDNVITTEGINLEEIRLIKGIDQERIFINDIALVYKMFGIEGARNILITELKRTFSGGGAEFNYQHLVVLADLMSYTGEIISIDRHGTNKMELDPLARASFERTMEHFVNAAIYNQKDRVKATSSRIMTGRVIPGGTGSFELLLDTNKLANSEFLDDEYQGRVNFDAFKDNELFKDIMENDEVNIDSLTSK